jgi:hypothetical protein
MHPPVLSSPHSASLRHWHSQSNHASRYTDEEYANLNLVDSSWPRDDTDEMMALAKRFDLRFVISSIPRLFN